MEFNVKLDNVNEYGAYEIRLESIGGLGANLSGKILGELGALYLGLNSGSFASYGSEKKGSPVRGYIRWVNPETELRITSPIEQPHLLGLFHEGLAGKELVMAGVNESTTVVLNTALTPDEARDRIKMCAGKLVCIDALKIAMDVKSRVNMVMLGALVKASGFIPLEALEIAVEETIGKRYPASLSSNIDGIRGGYENTIEKYFDFDNKYPYEAYHETQNDLGYINQPIGGINPQIGSTVTNDLSASREGYVPLFHKEKCINCGLCDVTCPDMVYQFERGTYRGKSAMVNLGPDYHHCKGCLRCVEICPTDAITGGVEREHDIWKKHIRNQELIVDTLQFEDAGPNSWIQSESVME